MEKNLAEKIFNQITLIARKHTNKVIENYNEFGIDRLEFVNAIKSKKTKESVFWSITHIPSKGTISIGLALSYKKQTINIMNILYTAYILSLYNLVKSLILKE